MLIAYKAQDDVGEGYEWTTIALLWPGSGDLASVLLRLARARVQGAGFWPDSILNERSITGEPDNAYPYYKKAQVEAHVNEGWQCLQRDGLIGPSPGENERNGFTQPPACLQIFSVTVTEIPARVAAPRRAGPDLA